MYVTERQPLSRFGLVSGAGGGRKPRGLVVSVPLSGP